MDKKANGDGNRIDQIEEPAKERKLRLVEEGVKTNYANVFNIGFGQEEVILMFGAPSVEPNVVKIENKVAVSLKTAKRFAITLGNLLRRYEAVNGEIDVSAPKASTEETPKVQ